MQNIGLCTHFTETDEWAFEYALELARTRHCHLNICHWLESPYQLRRDMLSIRRRTAVAADVNTPAGLDAVDQHPRRGRNGLSAVGLQLSQQFLMQFNRL